MIPSTQSRAVQAAAALPSSSAGTSRSSPLSSAAAAASPPDPQLNRSERANNLRLPPEKGEGVIRIMSANIRRRTMDGSRNWPLLRDKAVAVFNRCAPDVLAIQETDLTQLSYTLQNLHIRYETCGYIYCTYTSVNSVTQSYDEMKSFNPATNRRIRDDERLFVPILYNPNKMTFVDSGCYPLDKTVPELTPWAEGTYMEHQPGRRTVDIVTWVVLKQLETNKLWLIQNTRFDSGNPTNHARCIDVVKEQTDKLMGKSYSEMKVSTVVFTGDLNLFPNKIGKQAYAKLAASFSDVRDLAKHHFGPDGTFVGYEKRYLFQGNPYAPQRNGKSPDRLDHMFIQGDQVDVINEAVIADNPDLDDLHANPFPLHRPPNTDDIKKRSPSDHYFIAVDFAPKADPIQEQISAMQIK